MTPRTLDNKLKGYRNKEATRMFFERRLAHLQIASSGAKIRPEHIYPLEIDNELGSKEDLPTKEETLKVIEEFKRVNPKLFRPRGNK